MDDCDIWLGRVLWAYNLTVHGAFRMMKWRIKNKIWLGETEQDVWLEAHQRFCSFKVRVKC